MLCCSWNRIEKAQTKYTLTLLRRNHTFGVVAELVNLLKIKIMEKIQMPMIGNYYGGLHVMTLDGKFYWCIENHNTDFDDITDWDEITKELYEALVKFANNHEV